MPWSKYFCASGDEVVIACACPPRLSNSGTVGVGFEHPADTRTRATAIDVRGIADYRDDQRQRW
jgi:hypothetical protein